MDKNNYIVAVDLGSGSVKVAAGGITADGKLNVLDVVSKPMEGMVRGEVMNIEQVTTATREAVSELEQNLGIKVTDAFTGVSGQDIKCVENAYFVFVTGEDGEIREMDVEKLHESMNNLQPPESIAILDRIPQKYVIDNAEETLHPVGRFGHQLEATFNFVLGNRSAMDRMGKAFARLGIRQERIFTNAQATAAAVLNDDERELGVAVVDIGAGCTDICIWQDNRLRHVAVIPIGSDAINKDIRSIAVPDRFIEKLKVMHGYAVADRIPEEKRTQTIKIKGRNQRETKEVSFYNLAQIIEARLTDIIDHMLEEIKEAGYTDRLGSGIVLTGGGAQINDIDALFREKTKYDVRLGATEHSLVNKESWQAADDMSLSTVLGLLLLGLKESNLKPLREPLYKRGRPEAAEPAGRGGYEVDTEDEDTGRRAPDTREPKDGGKKWKEPKVKKKGGPFRWFKKLTVDMFEVIDDEEIE